MLVKQMVILIVCLPQVVQYFSPFFTPTTKLAEQHFSKGAVFLNNINAQVD